MASSTITGSLLSRWQGAWLTTKAAGRCRGRSTSTVEAMARRSITVGRTTIRQRSAALAAATVSAGEEARVSMIIRSTPAFSAVYWAGNSEPSFSGSTEGPSPWRERAQSVAEPWGSMSAIMTRRPALWALAARLQEMVVLPVPPFWAITAIVRIVRARDENWPSLRTNATITRPHADFRSHANALTKH